MEETIAQIATPPGEGGIGIVRISGPEAGEILSKIFRPFDEKAEMKGRSLCYGHIVDPEDGSVVDEVLSVFMKGPKTYTGEDVAEIDCHGGIVPLRRTLELAFSFGARPAERGEFTKRAFLNGRIDLSQAEAVMDIVKAKADRSFDVAMDQLRGKLSEEIRGIRKKLMDLLVELTVNIDYPDEDIEVLTYEKAGKALDEILSDVTSLIKGSRSGRIVSEGLRTSIIGKPNVGKSSLMNALLKEARAIVTDIPGTTRDTIEESLSIAGYPVVLTDTAGIRETEDEIESIGIERSKNSFNEADLVILMLDGSKELADEDFDIIRRLDAGKTLIVINKNDLERCTGTEEVREALVKEGSDPDALAGGIIETSLKEDEGVEVIEKKIEELITGGEVMTEESTVVTSARHAELLREAEAEIKDAVAQTEKQEPLEIIEINVNQAYEDLGKITGETVEGDILDEVFSRFCLGK